MKKEYSSVKIRNGFKENDEAIITYTYNNCFRYISWHIINDGGTLDDAKDVMQEAMILLFRNCKNSKFKWESHPFTQINNSSKYLWLNKKRKEKKIFYTLDYLEEVASYSEEMNDSTEVDESEMMNYRKNKIYKECFFKLKDECKALLTLVAKGESTSGITKKMKFKNDNITIERKRRCKERLLDIISIHPKYKKT